MSSSMDAELLDSDMGLEYDLHESDFGDDGLEEGSEEEEDDEAMDEPLIAARKDGDMIESYDRRELISNEVSSYMEPVEGMEFDSEECARAFYASYARHAGFRVRSSKSRRSVGDGAVVCRQFVCSREGFYMERPQGGGREQAEVIAGVGCMARLVVRRQPSGRWVVSKFEREHNHDPLENVALRKMKKVEGSLQQAESPPEKSAVFASPCGNPELEPYEGMEFSSEEAARAFYYTYAKDMGFTVRISKCRRARDGSIVCRRFVCSKEGYYVRKYGEPSAPGPPVARAVQAGGRPPGSQSPVSWRFSKLHQEGIKFAEEGSSSVEVFNVAMFALREASQKVIAAKSGVLRAPQTGNDEQHSWPNDPGNQQGPNEGRRPPSLSDLALIFSAFENGSCDAVLLPSGARKAAAKH
ncbi:unnamed protein product [Spirodela intermedia]|uniref:FAR1 domain-containing protein n=1 Tax=Spirodela intermedia TaxID=51605 RepID=A0A7I8IYY0_SPIIN|nr:unnamed protein product [Spirodela intermedia]CAA6663087.1 unnamed protein product [Spirodela intermedia]